MLQKKGALRTEFTIPSSKIFPEIEKYNSSFKNISYKKCCKKRWVFQTEFTIIHTRFTYKITIPRSIIFLGIEKYNANPFQNISCKKCCKNIFKMGVRILWDLGFFLYRMVGFGEKKNRGEGNLSHDYLMETAKLTKHQSYPKL